MVQLYGSEFFADPHRTYQRMHLDRELVVPVEIGPGNTATAVIGFVHAREVLDDPLHYPSDPVAGQSEHRDRPDLAQATGADHARLRRTVRECLERTDQHELRATVGEFAALLIATFSLEGSADLVGEFAIPLVVYTFSRMLGVPPDMWHQADIAVRTLRTTGDTSALTQLVWSAVESARMTPGADVASWLCRHPETLDDYEVVQQVQLLYTSGCLATIDLIANTLMLAMTDEVFCEDVMCGSLSLRDALEHVLAVEPPRPTLRPRFPPNLQIRDGVHLYPNQPVLLSVAGCAADPVMATDHTRKVGNRSHLAWGGGQHKCPDAAAAMAMLIAEEALNLLLESLPDMKRAPGTRIEWLHTLYHRALVALSVTFAPTPPLPHP
ncbi:hypothetical protein [Nocardia sp. GAS34]|uniref:hypothetical protein n=1 Tax=unclassified Nocardia TaxID=2637762 RepID=UPI003D25915E